MIVNPLLLKNMNYPIALFAIDNYGDKILKKLKKCKLLPARLLFKSEFVQQKSPNEVCWNRPAIVKELEDCEIVIFFAERCSVLTLYLCHTFNNESGKLTHLFVANNSEELINVNKYSIINVTVCNHLETIEAYVRVVYEIIEYHGVIDIDFCDLKSSFQDASVVKFAVGIADGKNRAIDAVKLAVDRYQITGPKSILAYIGCSDEHEATIEEIGIINEYICENNPYSIFACGIYCDNNLGSKLKVNIIATGFDAQAISQLQPAPLPDNNLSLLKRICNWVKRCFG